MKFLSLLGAEIEQNIYFAAAILKIQNGGHADISANVINDFRIPHGLTFPKMYRFANLPKIFNEINFIDIVNLTICVAEYKGIQVDINE